MANDKRRHTHALVKIGPQKQTFFEGFASIAKNYAKVEHTKIVGTLIQVLLERDLIDPNELAKQIVGAAPKKPRRTKRKIPKQKVPKEKAQQAA